MPKYRIGCSGFLYDSWSGPFYPEDLPHKKWLSFYMDKFTSVELNVTFYRLLKKEAFERWYKETRPGTSFCLKGSRFITHVKKLKDVELPLSTFFNTTAPLMEKLEVILWQLPPNLKLNLKNLEDFVEHLKQYPVRHAFEFRHKSWLTKRVFNLLSSANIAVCMADWPEFINDLPLTANFVYIRRHGERGGFATNYTGDQLKADAKRIKEYMKLGKDVYLYFNNDAFAYAPKNAIELNSILDSILPKSLLEKPEAKEIRPKKARVAKKKPVRKPAKKAVKKTAKKAVKKTAKKAVRKTAKKAVRKTAKKAVRKTAKKAVRKTAAKKVTKKAATKKITAKKTATRKTATRKAARPLKRATKKTVKKSSRKK